MKMQRDPAGNGLEAGQTISAVQAVASLSSEVARSVGPTDLAQAPVLTNEEAAARSAELTGRIDVRSESIDHLSEDPVLPSQYAVTVTVQKVADVVGARAHQVRAALDAGELAGPDPVPDTRRWWQKLSPATLVMGIVVIVLEAAVGATFWRIGLRASDEVAWLIGIVLAIGLAAVTHRAAELAFRSRPHLVQARGVLFLVATAVVLGVLLAAYAWSLAGGVRMTIDAPVLSGGGVAGGSPATDTAAGTLSWPLLLVYGAMLVLFCFAMFLAHLLDFDRVDHEMADAAMAAADAKLSDREQELLCADLLEAHLNLIEPSERFARSLIGCYISGARAEMSPELSGIWDSSGLEDLSLPAPEWAEEIGAMVKQLRRQDVVGRELKVVSG